MEEFNLEQKIVHRLILQSPFISDIGLLYGKMGIALLFYEYARYTSCDIYNDMGEELLDDVLNQIHKGMSIRFDIGLSGIGWGIKYLLQNRFIEGDENEICEEIDHEIMRTDLLRIDDFSLESGLEGLFYYISARLNGKSFQKDNSPFDTDYLKDLSCINPFFKIEDVSGFCLRYPISTKSILNEIVMNESSYMREPLGLRGGVAGYLLCKILRV